MEKRPFRRSSSTKADEIGMKKNFYKCAQIFVMKTSCILTFLIILFCISSVLWNKVKIKTLEKDLGVVSKDVPELSLQKQIENQDKCVEEFLHSKKREELIKFLEIEKLKNRDVLKKEEDEEINEIEREILELKFEKQMESYIHNKYDITMMIASVMPDDFETHPIHDFIKAYLKRSADDRNKGLKFHVVIGYDFNDQNWHHYKINFLTKLARKKLLNTDFSVVQVPEEFSGEPVYVWNYIFETYIDTSDYFFQIGDDVELLSNDFGSLMIQELQNRRCKNFGVAGPLDFRKDIVEQTFVSRLHYDIFGFYFPDSFRNWCCDTWISKIYYNVNPYLCPESYKLMKNVWADNTGRVSERHTYKVDENCKKKILPGEIKIASKILDDYIVEHYA